MEWAGMVRPANMPLWDEEVLHAYAKPFKKPLATVAREHAATYGVKNTGLAGVLAAILGGSVPDSTMNVLLTEGLRNLAGKTVEELSNLPGIGKDKALRLVAAFELARRLASLPPEEKPAIRGPEDVAALFVNEMRHLEKEHMVVLLLDTKNRVVDRETVSIGTMNSCLVHPRELFKSAIKRNAAAVILVHNHPSGDPLPSAQDREITRRLVEAGQIIGIEVLDHVIIGDGNFTSMKAKGLI